MARLSRETVEPKGNQVLRGRKKESHSIDPKPGDLPMSRLKLL